MDQQNCKSPLSCIYPTRPYENQAIAQPDYSFCDVPRIPDCILQSADNIRPCNDDFPYAEAQGCCPREASRFDRERSGQSETANRSYPLTLPFSPSDANTLTTCCIAPPLQVTPGLLGPKPAQFKCFHTPAYHHASECALGDMYSSSIDYRMNELDSRTEDDCPDDVALLRFLDQRLGREEGGEAGMGSAGEEDLLSLDSRSLHLSQSLHLPNYPCSYHAMLGQNDAEIADGQITTVPIVDQTPCRIAQNDNAIFVIGEAPDLTRDRQSLTSSLGSRNFILPKKFTFRTC
ncbi:unnamed protein product [Protopolystoma xenopodis]|uniref:Uncharacterized protein n=1 Tax=Protopolystoma xenopodis TaxID=117903 RepID=A0A448XIG2_9PLAT|nr:unnamed protein product [Protopolystoma xenopodis]